MSVRDREGDAHVTVEKWRESVRRQLRGELLSALLCPLDLDWSITTESNGVSRRRGPFEPFVKPRILGVIVAGT